MSLVDIKKKIESDANNEAQALLAKANSQAEAIADEAAEVAASIEKELQERLKKDGPEIFRRREVVARLDVKKIALGAKQQLIDQTFQLALDGLVGMEKKKYLAFCGKLLEKASKAGDGTVLVGRDEKHLDSSWLDAFNQKNSTHLILEEERLSIRGGFVLRRGQVDVNCSFEMLVRSLREELEKDVVTRLFSN